MFPSRCCCHCWRVTCMRWLWALWKENCPPAPPCGSRTALQWLWSWPVPATPALTRKGSRSRVKLVYINIKGCRNLHLHTRSIHPVFTRLSFRPVPGPGHGTAGFPRRYYPEGWKCGFQRRSRSDGDGGKIVPGGCTADGQPGSSSHRLPRCRVPTGHRPLGHRSPEPEQVWTSVMKLLQF